MRFVEFTSGLQTFVTKEEQELIETMSKGPVKKRDLSEREQQVAPCFHIQCAPQPKQSEQSIHTDTVREQ